MDLMWHKLSFMMKVKTWKFSELSSSFRCNKFEDYICKDSNLNTKNAEINDELIMCIFKVVTSDQQ